VCTSHLLCITAVPGASEGDYQGSEWTLEDPLQANKEKKDSTGSSGGVVFSDPLGKAYFCGSNRVHTVIERSWKVMEFETCIPGLEKSWILEKCVKVMEKSWNFRFFPNLF